MRSRSLSIVLALLFLVAAAPTRARSAPAGVTFTVDAAADVADANPGDGICETSPGNQVCTLRAAEESPLSRFSAPAALCFSALYALPPQPISTLRSSVPQRCKSP